VRALARDPVTDFAAFKISDNASDQLFRMQFRSTMIFVVRDVDVIQTESDPTPVILRAQPEHANRAASCMKPTIANGWLPLQLVDHLILLKTRNS
jgi:hypothetical protein